MNKDQRTPATLEDFLARSEAAFQNSDDCRTSHSYQNKDNNFAISKEERQNQVGQYAHLYFVRYAQIRPFVVEQLRSARHFPRSTFKEEIKDLTPEVFLIFQPQEGDVCFVAIIIKKMKLTPSVLREGGSDYSTILGYKKAESFISPEQDQLFLEDPSGRIQVNTKISPLETWNLSNGIVVGVKGTVLNDMLFLIKEVILPGIPSSPPLPATVELDSSISVKEDDKYVAFVSGLQFGLNKDYFALQALKCFLEGSIFPELSKNIVRLVIAGNSLRNIDEIEQVVRGSYRYKDLNQRVYQNVSEIREQLDAYLAILSRILPLDLMPGDQDLSSTFIPQQPMPKFIFPLTFGDPKSKADMASLTVMATNPHSFELQGLSFLGTAGDNVSSFMSQADPSQDSKDAYSPEINAMKHLLQCRHICPTAPQLLRCACMLNRDILALTPFPVPSIEQVVEDPSLDSTAPHIFFAGNMKRFEYQQIEDKRTWLLCVPRFSVTRQIVLLNLRTLEAKILEFKTKPADYI